MKPRLRCLAFRHDRLNCPQGQDVHFAGSASAPSSPDAPNSTASHRAERDWAQNVSAAMAIGTPMKAPNKPQRKVHRNTENSTTKGEMASFFPATRGSM